MGVTVQQMVDAEVSGVMFTCNPVSGDPSTVAVNASWGLGLAVVGGEVTPDDYLVSKVTRRGRAPQHRPEAVEYVAGPDGAERVDVEAATGRTSPASTTGSSPRSSSSAGASSATSAATRTSSGRSTRDGELFVLQSRPVTVAPREARRPAGKSAMDLVMGTFGAGKKD